MTAKRVAARTLTLHPYQAEMLKRLEEDADSLLASPTGSGKTTIAATAARLSFAMGTTHAIIAAPQKQIEEGFVECNGLEVRWPEGSKRKRPIVIPDGFIRPLKPGVGMARKVLEYLADPTPGYVLACSHAALTVMLRLFGEHALPEFLATATLIVDEAHHAPADELSGVVAAWQSRGGRLRFYTATPERADGRAVATPGMVRIVRSLAEHMLEGYAPGEIVNELVPFKVTGVRISGAEFTGEAVTQDAKDLKRLAQAIVARWEADGRPKAIVRVPPMRGGCGPLVSLLVRLFAKVGARVVDSTGLGMDPQRAFRAMLGSERGRSFADSRHDIIIGSQRVVEGTDWPVCSHIYSVGIPGSLTLLQQLLGRATRRKDDKHPSRDRVKITFLYPTAGGHSLDSLSMEHSRQALLVCVFLADHESGEALLAPMGHAFNAYEYAQVKLFMAADLAGRESGTATVGELVDAAREAMPEAEDGLIDYVAMRLMANGNVAVGGKGGGGANIFKERIKLTPEIDAPAKAEFAKLVEIFRGMTLEEYGSLRALGTQLHKVTGGQTREVARRFRETIGRPLTEEMIESWVEEWKERTGDWPGHHSGEIPGENGLTWNAIHQSLSGGYHGLPGGSTLSSFLTEHFGVRNRMNLPDLTIDTIVKWVSEWHKRERKYPTTESGEIPGSNGETWSAIAQALRNGIRGLPSDKSLPQLIAEHFGVRNATNKTDLTIDSIKRWVIDWYDMERTYPTLHSGVIPGTNGETWIVVDQGLRKGNRGLPGGSSLARLIAEHFGVRNATNPPKLAEVTIRHWVTDWSEQKGKWPNQKSGPIPDSGGETWKAVDTALRDGRRGLPGGSSLPKLIAQQFGRRNVSNLPKLTINIIKRWVEEWQKHKGCWPSKRSGEIPGSRGETWHAVNSAFIDGRRGLSSGSSLFKFIAEHFPDSRKPTAKGRTAAPRHKPHPSRPANPGTTPD